MTTTGNTTGNGNTGSKASPEGASDSVWSWGLTEFRDRTAEPNPTPGGGAAAMVSAAVGMGLVVMALRVTLAKAKSDDQVHDLEATIAAATDIMDRASAFADIDIEAFNGFMAALRLPKSSDEEKAARADAMAAATVVATEVPLNAAATCLEGLDLAARAEPMVGDMIVSDVGAGASMLNGALQAVLLNVDINLRGLKDAAARADYQTSRRHLASSGTDRYAAIADRLQIRLG